MLNILDRHAWDMVAEILGSHGRLERVNTSEAACLIAAYMNDENPIDALAQYRRRVRDERTYASRPAIDAATRDHIAPA